MKIKLITFCLIICIASTILPGCVFISADFRRTKDLIISELGHVEVETEIQFQVGSGLLSISELAISCTDADDEALGYLKDISNVQVGIYKLYNSPRDLRIPKKIGQNLHKKGYIPIVKVKEPGNAIWVLTKMRGKHLNSLYIIVLERDELVLVEVEGRLEKIVEKAIREHGLDKKEFMGI